MSISHDRAHPQDPRTGPAAVALLHGFLPDSLIHDPSRPADLWAAQQTPGSGLITAEWHHVASLEPPIDPCGTDNCVRFEYSGGDSLRVQRITGEPVTVEEPAIAFTALRMVLHDLETGGAGYSVLPYMLETNALARNVVAAGHQLTIPGAEEVSRALRFPQPAPPAV